MIEKMMKYSFLVYYKEYEQFIEKLYDLGVVHVIAKENATTIHEKLEDKIALLKQYSSAVNFLKKKIDVKNYNPDIPFTPTAESLIEDFNNLRLKEDELNHQLTQIKKDIDILTPWGDFDKDIINKIAVSGYHINLFSCPHKSFKDSWINDYYSVIVSSSSINHYFFTVTKDEHINIEADSVKLPSESLSHLKSMEDSINQQLNEISKQYIYFASNFLQQLEIEEKRIRADFNFSEIRLNTESVADEKVKLIEGWTPLPKIDSLENYLNNNGILFTSREPDVTTDNVPVLLKNNKFAKLFEPLGELYTLPEYGEIDLTPFFAPFYMLFFGLCLGDCGYGLILAVAAFILAAKAKPSMKGIFKLAGWLGVATVIMGTISGTFFGISLLDSQWPWLDKFKCIMMDSNKLFVNSLILGVIQIIFGMIIKIFNAFKQNNISGGIVTIGWLIIILGCGGTFALSSNLLAPNGLITDGTAKTLYITCGLIGGICVFFLNNLNFGKKNLFGIINIGSGLWDAYNMATGILGDVLSYIRLFALGISGSVMGFVFNSLAMDISPDIIIVKQLVMLIILLIGHGMNIFMSALSAFVHPMRLTFVEFYKNSGFTGGGKKYKPFGETSE